MSQPSEIEKNLRIAEHHILTGNFEKGADLCSQILQAGHESVEAKYLLAIAAYNLGNDEEAIYQLRSAIALKPDNEHFLATLSHCFRRLGRNEDALDCLRLIVQLNPNSIGAWRTQGKILLATGMLDAALAAYRRVLDVVPDDHAALVDFGEILFRQGRLAEAAQYLKKALTHNNESTLAMARLGAIFAAEGCFEEAQPLLLEAIKGAPEQPEAYKTLGDLAYAEGRLEEAVEYFQKHFECKHSLIQLAKKYRTDKWGDHYYAQHYHKHFFPLRNREINVLEIGVGGYLHPLRGGGSLRMWKAFFSNGNIFAIDINDKSALADERIRIFQGSQEDSAFLRHVADEIGRIDIVIDDGSHINSHVIETFKTLFPLMADEGIYVVEDTQTSYWPKFGGESNDLNYQGSSLSFFKGLSDGLNYQELLLPDYSPSYFEQNIVAMHFYHNMVFIYKGHNNEGSKWVKNGVLLLD